LERKKSRGIIVKVDYGKAYDLVDFLAYMMDRLGFSLKWTN